MEGARGIEPPPRCSGEANGFEDRGVPSTIAPLCFVIITLFLEKRMYRPEDRPGFAPQTAKPIVISCTGYSLWNVETGRLLTELAFVCV